MSEAVVKAVVAAHPEFSTNPDRDAAKAVLLPYVVDALNKATRTTNWGVLVKTDQGNKVPNDIVCWKPTREIVDCLSDSGAMWDEKGVAPNPAWVWGPGTPVAAPTAENPAPPAQPQPDEPSYEEFVQEIVSRVSTFVGHEADRIYSQNERVFANLTAQNREIVGLLTALGGREYIATTNLPAPAPPLTVPQPDGGLHLTPEALGRIADVAGSVLSLLAQRKK